MIKSLKRVVIIITVLAIQFNCACGQDRKVDGRILWDEDFSGIAGVTIQTFDTKYKTETDSSGRFSFNIPITYDAVTISFIGSDTIRTTIHANKPIYELLSASVVFIDPMRIRNYSKARIERSKKRSRARVYKNALRANVFEK